MQVIKEHLKQQTFKPVYLLYGTEDYLKKLYKTKLKAGILGDSDDMNFSFFEGKGIDLIKAKEISETLPFFNERRLIILENTGLFKDANDFADYIKTAPSSTHFVFIEKEVDKRNRLYKAVKDIGTIVLMDGLDEKNLTLWVASLLKQHQKKITQKDILYLLQKSGTDMEGLSTEIEKLICYAMDRDVITQEDIDAICTTQITGKIFQMMDAIGSKNQKVALSLYHDLLALREKPMSILFLITRHFKILLQTKGLSKEGHSNSILAQKIGIPPFTVGKYLTQSKNFSIPSLEQALFTCVSTEEQVKTGHLGDQLAVELLLIQFSQ